MKSWLLLFALLALLLLTAALAPLLKSDPGVVQVHFLDWTIETSVLVLVGAFLLLWLTLQLLFWLYQLPARTAARVAERRAMEQMEKGLLALTEGDWKTAEKALGKSASLPGKTTARYLAAAQAADSLDHTEQRDYYLEQADSGGKHRRFLVELTRARMLMQNGRRAEALPLLEDLFARRKAHAQVLGLLARCCRELGKWERLRELLPALGKSDVMTEQELSALQIEIAQHELSGAENAEALQAAWKALPKVMQREARVIEVYAERAGKLERADLAESVLRSSLKKDWDQGLVLRYGDPGSGDAAVRLKQCEKWLQTHPDDPALHMALGRLCAGQELWGKARTHLVKSLEYQPSSAGYDALGQLLERLGEMELAMACFRNALRMNQGRAPEPLPRDPARLAAPE
jgi:HemY protein